ncbi:hypothetical protein NQ318_004628 [Aromia moschata]|uniref:C2H2-type domain-containing protein n=1 Tax=Aromia moschata TaxID=1265417 RepID=A0AAV8Y6E5_9CUCU|nr:hypothetical protein NQ318_004628 [Aromia moschata]
MANNSGVQQQSQQQQHFLQQQTNSPFYCKECGISLNSAESLEVHVQYHKENLLKNWAVQAASSHSEETNNNTPKANNKRELLPNNIITAADSSDSMQKKSPEYSSATPDQIFGHPPTPQSYQSASSPYQNHDNSAFSPNFPNYQQQQMKSERTSPNPQQQQQQYQQNNYSNYADSQYFIESNQNQQQYSEPFAPKAPVHNPSYRYHPYPQAQHSPYERQPSQAQVSSSSPAYPPQPTPSPSPKQCDKCGYVCQSASQLIEHLNMAHPPTPAPHLSAYQPNQHFMFDQPAIVKQEDNSQSEILDLDSHKVVHNVYSDEEKRQADDPNGHNPHSVSAMLNSWSPSQHQTAPQSQQQKMFQQQQEQPRMFMSGADQKMFSQNIQENIPENKMFSPEQKLFQPHQMQDFMVNGVTTTSQENGANSMNPLGSVPPHAYRPFEHLPSPPNAPVISSTQVPNNPPQQPPSSQKSATWKSNEARRPKTYNCTACNKWFTSSGHLKRHYNTTLHKNAVKSSGQPDPAALPISAHHHPARDNPSKQDDRPQSGSSGDEIRNDDSNTMPPQFERINAMPLLQQPPNGPYDRQPAPNIHHTTPLHSPMPHSPMPHSPMPQHPSPLGNHLVNPALSNLSNGSPPNGEAGLSTNNIDSRACYRSHMMAMESNQFQMYPNGSAPHVTQAMAINNLSTTGEFQFASQNSLVEENQPLPSFAQIQAHRYGLIGYGVANVGAGVRNLLYRAEDDEYRLTVLTAADPAPVQDDYLLQYSPNHNNNHTDEMTIMSLSSENDTKMNIMEETKMQMMEDIKLRLEAQPKSPEKAHTKRDYEENTGSPQVSSTVSAKQGLHKCYDCVKTFNKACYLTQHNKTFHCGEKPFKCSRCGKRFSCEVTYQEHLSKHAGDKPHKCDLCPKQFNHKTDLRRHMCLHTGQKPYACDTCGKGFIRKDHMMKHCETHLRKTQSKIAGIR